MIKQEQLTYQDYLFLKENFNTLNASYDTFKKRFEPSFKYYKDDVLKSVIYYKKVNNQVHISFIFSFEKGCGRTILSEFINNFSDCIITANVRESNIASLKLFSSYFIKLNLIKNKYSNGENKILFISY